ncbi:hypothetical protein DFA_08445 [Cavenderia fasciculata]|uniref:Uncharacterized protein n=1 Tax=Cavenderia fasciculata TaxID=261658 RepID=F4Q676_CACFS|nr:uncharacterized protein DFA_08445 [Cavenderia fasciculata]EGG17450.1 hypothetical protein DFA_08445 [Cavenderia fasciculata]|eukprot:XP_004355934.1 hypothetical protein DFA_08445 [Cavenderia fasciculata]
MTSLLNLSNTIISQIISEIEDNGDIICLLLTCKGIYQNDSIKRSIQFKGIEAIDTINRCVSEPFTATATRYNLKSFQDILENSISNHQVMILKEKKKRYHSYNAPTIIDYPQWIQQRISLTDRDDDKSGGIITALVNDPKQSPSLEPLSVDMPSLETLFINQKRGKMDLGSISSLLPCLQRLAVSADKVKFGHNTSLKSLLLECDQNSSLTKFGLSNLVSLTELTIEPSYVCGLVPGLLPSSLTSVTIGLFEVPPRDTFLSLTSLVYLSLQLVAEDDTKKEEEPCIDLEDLHTLKTLKFKLFDDTQDKKYILELSVPPSLTTLDFNSKSAYISTRSTLPKLEKLSINQVQLFDARVNSLLVSPSLKKLVIYNCNEIMPAHIIPSTLEKLTIFKLVYKDILGQVVFPPSLTHLSVLGLYCEELTQPLPESIIKLKLLVNTRGAPKSPLPQHLKKLVWVQPEDTKINGASVKFPSSYPPTLETLDLSDIQGEFTIDNMPPSTKHLAVDLPPLTGYEDEKHTKPVYYYSISSLFPKSILDQQQWLSPNTTHLTCQLNSDDRRHNSRVELSLYDIILYTNIRYLTVIVFMSREQLHSSLLKQSIQVGEIIGIEPIDTDYGETSKQFIVTATRFNLNSFKDILVNSILSNHQVILGNQDDLPQWIQQRVIYQKIVDKSKSGDIKTALVEYTSPLSPIYSAPSIETLFINESYDQSVDLDSISLLPRLQRLEVRAGRFNIGRHTSLKYLKLEVKTESDDGIPFISKFGLNGLESLTELNMRYCSQMTGLVPGLLPSTLTSLTLSLMKVPPRNTFISLTSLVTLDLGIYTQDGLGEVEEEHVPHEDEYGEVQEQKQYVDLESLHTLKTLKFYLFDQPHPKLELCVPPSLTTLDFYCRSIVQIPSRCTMPSLEKLCVQQMVLIDGNINLLPCTSPSTSLKKLVLYDCDQPIRPGNTYIPSTLEKLSIYNENTESILGQGVIRSNNQSHQFEEDIYVAFILAHVDIDDNGDIICLLLTCKQLYHNSALRRGSIQFKGVTAIDTDFGEISKPFIVTATRYNLNSFKDILENSILSYHHVILGSNKHDDLPQSIQERVIYEKRVDKSKSGDIKTALVVDTSQLSLESIYSIPSIETLFINESYDKSVDLDSISLLPRLQRLEVRADGFNIGRHTSLKYLKLEVTTESDDGIPFISKFGLNGLESLTELNMRYCAQMTGLVPGLLPKTLTSLTLSLMSVPPLDTFLSLTSLAKLDLGIYIHDDREEKEEDGDDVEEEVQEQQQQQQQYMDLETLHTLKTLKLDIFNKTHHKLELCVPPSLTTLDIFCKEAFIPSRCTMPSLEKLYVHQSLLIDQRISLESSPSLKKLVLYECDQPITPDNTFIPSTLEKLSIYNENTESILGQGVVFPPLLTHLTILGGDYEPIVHHILPESLVKLKVLVNNQPDPISLPIHLKKLVWIQPKTKIKDIVLLPSSYPPNLETLNLGNIKDKFMIDKNNPSTIKYLSMPLEIDNQKRHSNNVCIYSICSKFTNSILSQQQWLPINTTHLICHLDDRTKSSFRLDQVINHTNVRYLTIAIAYKPYIFTIQRLDTDNQNVLVLEKETLQGGIITQRKSINITERQYDPIYLFFENHFTSHLKVKWKFGNI